MTEVEPLPARERTRTALVEVAARLLREGGAGAITTRAVAQAAQVQAPTIYRIFGDKDGLLDAVAEHVMTTYVAAKSEAAHDEGAADGDPVDELRNGWDAHLDFCLANPDVFALLVRPDRAGSAANAAGLEVLGERVRRVAVAGRLRVPEARAIGMLRASGNGAVLGLLATPDDQRDTGLAAAMWDVVAAALFTDAPDDDGRAGEVAAAVTLRAAVPDLDALSEGERALLGEWLDRVASG